MRVLFLSLVLICVAGAGAALVQYGTVDPCRMLAQEMARDTLGPVARALGNDPDEVPESAERSMRLITSQYSAQTCAKKLWGRWTDSED